MPVMRLKAADRFWIHPSRKLHCASDDRVHASGRVSDVTAKLDLICYLRGC